MIKPLFFITLTLQISCQSKHWSYSENQLSNSWADISKDYQLCRDGKQQSPIDLSMSISNRVLQKINIDYHDEYAEILNNGHTIKEKFIKSNHIEINNHKYYLNQLHFHAHSEHSLDGIYYPLEIHLVHQSSSGELAVVALLVEISSKNKNEYGFFKNIDKEKTFVKLSKLVI